MCGIRDRSRWQCAHRETARRRAGSGLFSSLPLVSFFMGCIMSICAWVFMPWMVEVMGAQGQILTDSVFWPYTACFLSFALNPAHISGILRYRGKPVSQLLNECGLRHD